MSFRSISWGRVFFALCLAAGWAASAVAQDTSFVLISQVAGESQDPDHPNWIEAYGLSTVSTNPGGGPVNESVHLLKGTDMATPLLMQRLLQATDMGQVRIEVCRNPPGGQECYYKLILEGTRVVGLSTSGSSCIDPSTSCTPAQTESVELSYSKITWTYVGFPGSGKSGCTCWDAKVGKTCSCTP
jgi:type VI secretion system Hcp family effector